MIFGDNCRQWRRAFIEKFTLWLLATLEFALQAGYIGAMSNGPEEPLGFQREKEIDLQQESAGKSPDNATFTGKVVRVEADGFGIVEFDKPIGTGPHITQLGIFSNTTSTALPSFSVLQPGAKVSGTADADDHKLAAVRTLKILP